MHVSRQHIQAGLKHPEVPWCGCAQGLVRLCVLCLRGSGAVQSRSWVHDDPCAQLSLTVTPCAFAFIAVVLLHPHATRQASTLLRSIEHQSGAQCQALIKQRPGPAGPPCASLGLGHCTSCLGRTRSVLWCCLFNSCLSSLVSHVPQSAPL